ncbi:purine nucleoside phosphorylase LACC1-like [Ambystoma mexicanum]|uniref:purine nucleoside phosphorylase LACC1-like n=1 Tax=Ambystoma mexicanum TaxID=8296 RepID=UPI0037E92808
MTEAVLIDMFSTENNGRKHSIEPLLRRAMTIVGEQCAVEDLSVYIMYCQTFGCDTNDARDSFLHALRCFQGLKRRIELVSNASVAATLYTIKQKLDQKNASVVKIILPLQRKAAMQVYVNSLFTEVYTIGFEILSMDSGDNNLQPSVGQHCESDSLTGQQLDLIKSDIHMHLGSLRANGEFTILKSSLIPDTTFIHGFSTRTGGISYLPNLESLNLFSSPKRKDPEAVVAENVRRLAKAVGFNPERFHLLKAAHGNDVWIMGKTEPDSYDGIVANQKGVTIAAPGADCIPLLFSDPVKKAYGAAHSGWKGTLLGVAMATVNAMVSEFGCSKKDVLIALGPSIGPCCFTLSQEEAIAFHTIDPKCVQRFESPTPSIDLRKATRILLERGGIPGENIQDHLTLCTSCHPDLFFSHHRDGPNFGTQIGFISVRN